MLQQNRLRIYLSLALIAAATWLLHGFIPALIWATVIAIATWPLRELVAGKTGWGETAVATLMACVAGVLLFLPVGYVLFHLASEARGIAHWVVDAQKSGVPVLPWVPGIPGIGPSLSAWWQANLADPVALSSLLGHTDSAAVADYARRFGAQVAHRFVTMAFTVLTLFFLYKDGARLGRKTIALLGKLAGEGGVRYGRQAAVAIGATVNGLVLVGLAEGFLIGVSYFLAEAPHPVILGLITGVLAMVPFAAPIIFGAVSLILLAKGSLVAAVAVFAFGSLVLFVGDHFVRPAIIGNAVELPFLWVLLGILGGIEVFGLIGLFVGPALMALVMTMWRDLTEGVES